MARALHVREGGGGATARAPHRHPFNEYSLIRIAATLLVVLGHFDYISVASELGGVAYAFTYETDPIFAADWLQAIRSLVGWVYRFHMPLFFVLSGAVTGLSARPLTQQGFPAFLKKKALRLLVPFFLAGVFFLIPVKRLAGYYDSLAEALYSFTSLTSATEYGHLWFLVSLFWVSLMFYGLVWAIGRAGWEKDAPHVALLASALVSFGVFELLGAPGDGMLPEHLGIFAEIRRASSYLVYYAFGYWFTRGGIADALKSLRLRPLVLVALLVALVVDRMYRLLAIPFVTVLVWLTLFYAGLCLAPALGRFRLARFLDDRSMDVYLYHDPLEYLILRVAFGTTLLASFWGVIAYELARFFGVIVASLAIGAVVHRVARWGARVLSPAGGRA